MSGFPVPPDTNPAIESEWETLRKYILTQTPIGTLDHEVAIGDVLRIVSYDRNVLELVAPNGYTRFAIEVEGLDYRATLVPKRADVDVSALYRRPGLKIEEDAGVDFYFSQSKPTLDTAMQKVYRCSGDATAINRLSYDRHITANFHVADTGLLPLQYLDVDSIKWSNRNPGFTVPDTMYQSGRGVVYTEELRFVEPLVPGSERKVHKVDLRLIRWKSPPDIKMSSLTFDIENMPDQISAHIIAADEGIAPGTYDGRVNMIGVHYRWYVGDQVRTWYIGLHSEKLPDLTGLSEDKFREDGTMYRVLITKGELDTFYILFNLIGLLRPCGFISYNGNCHDIRMIIERIEYFMEHGIGISFIKPPVEDNYYIPAKEMERLEGKAVPAAAEDEDEESEDDDDEDDKAAAARVIPINSVGATMLRYKEIDLNNKRLKSVTFIIDGVECFAKNTDIGRAKNSKSLGWNLHIPFCPVFDVYAMLKEPGTDKMESYKLGNVAKVILNGETKDDMPYQATWDVYCRILALNHHGRTEEITPEDTEYAHRVISYCVQDCVLPAKIMEVRNMMQDYHKRAEVMGVPVSYIVTGGQQRRCAAKIKLSAMARGYYFSNHSVMHVDKTRKIEGAIVLDPKSQTVHKNMAVLDFASLYPSIIRAKNICPTTYVPEPRNTYKAIMRSGYQKYSEAGVPVFDEDGRAVREFIPEDMTYEEFVTKFINVISGTENGQPLTVCFLKKSIRIGILPVVLEDTIRLRKDYRKISAECKTSNPALSIAYEYAQLACKIICNSIYGMLGAKEGIIPFDFGARAVTMCGRNMIMAVKAFVEKDGVWDVIYGDTDSVMVVLKKSRNVFQTWQMACELEKEINSAGLFEPPNEIEFEKLASMCIFFSKKKYAMQLVKISTDPATGERKLSYEYKSAGVYSVRGNTAQFARKAMKTCENQLLARRPAPEMVSYVLSVFHHIARVNPGDADESLAITANIKDTQWIYMYVDKSCNVRSTGKKPTHFIQTYLLRCFSKCITLVHQFRGSQIRYLYTVGHMGDDGTWNTKKASDIMISTELFKETMAVINVPRTITRTFNTVVERMFGSNAAMYSLGGLGNLFKNPSAFSGDLFIELQKAVCLEAAAGVKRSRCRITKTDVPICVVKQHAEKARGVFQMYMRYLIDTLDRLTRRFHFLFSVVDTLPYLSAFVSVLWNIEIATPFSVDRTAVSANAIHRTFSTFQTSLRNVSRISDMAIVLCQVRSKALLCATSTNFVEFPSVVSDADFLASAYQLVRYVHSELKDGGVNVEIPSIPHAHPNERALGLESCISVNSEKQSATIAGRTFYFNTEMGLERMTDTASDPCAPLTPYETRTVLGKYSEMMDPTRKVEELNPLPLRILAEYDGNSVKRTHHDTQYDYFTTALSVRV